MDDFKVSSYKHVGLSRVNVYPEACSVYVENGYENDSSFTRST